MTSSLQPVFQNGDELLQALVRLRLLDPSQLTGLNRDGDVRALLDDLVQRGWLTPFQSSRLLADEGESLLLGNYVLLDKLGEGGMGAVYKARNWKLGPLVAIKVIRPERLSSENTLERFRREIRAAAALDHPHIVRALDADEDDGRFFLVMEYVEGIDLWLVRQRGPLSVGLAGECIRQAALGLQHAFEKGFVHRDIKPSNLLLAGGGATLKILDFGLARQTEGGDASQTLTQEGTLVGTPDFIAPEQTLDATAVDVRSDLYALGCTFYYLLTGRPPFPGGSLGYKIACHQGRDPEPIESIRPEVSAEVVAVVRRLMAKEPRERFQSPAELARTLEPASGGRKLPEGEDAGDSRPSLAEVNPFAVLEPAPTSSSATLAPRSRIPWLAAVGVIALIAAVLFWWSRPSPPEKEPLRIDANRPWQDSGFEVRAGDELVLRVRGQWRREGLSWCDATGNEKAPRTRAVWPDAPAMCLIGRIGDDPMPLALTRDRVTMPRAGRLFLQANELGLGEAEGTLLVSIAGAEPASGMLPSPPPLPIQRAQDSLNQLARRVRAREEGPSELRQELLRFIRDYGELPQSARVSELIRGLPSPLDRLDRSYPAWALGLDPKAAIPQLVALAADPRGQHIDSITHLVFGDEGIIAGDYSSWLKSWSSSDLTLLKERHVPLPRPLHAIAPDRRRVLTVSFSQHQPQLWDLEKGTTIRTFQRSEGFSHFDWRGGPYAAGVNQVGLTVWNTDTDTVSRTIRTDRHVFLQVNLSHDSRWGLLLAGNAKALVFETEGDRPPRELEKPPDLVFALALTHDGKQAAGGMRNGVVLWDVESGRIVRTLSKPKKTTYQLAFSPAGDLLAGGEDGGAVHLWDAREGKPLGSQFGHWAGVSALAWHPNGKQFVSSGMEHCLRVWDVSDRTLKAPLPRTGHGGRVLCLAFTPAGDSLLTAGRDATLRLWDLTGNAPDLKSTLTLSPGLHRGLALSSDGRMALASGGAQVYAVELKPGTRRFIAEAALDQSIIRMVPAANRRFAVLTDRGEIHSGWLDKLSAPSERIAVHSGNLCVSPDQGTLAWIGPGVQLHRRPVDGQTEALMKLGEEGIDDMAFTPDGRSLVILAKSGRAFVQALEGTKAARAFEPRGEGREGRLALSPDGRLIALTSSSGRVKVFRYADGGGVATWALPWAVKELTFAPDCRHLALASEGGVVVLRLEPIP